jgi:hypothetical protein
MPIWEYKGWSPMKGHQKGTIRATDSKDALANVLKKKLGGYGEATVRPKRKKKNETETTS